MITEDELRQALSEIAAEADTDTARDARPEELIDITATPERRRRTWWISAAAAAAVAAIVIPLVTLLGHGDGTAVRPASPNPATPRPATPSPATIAKPLVGTAWRLTEVRSARVIAGTRHKTYRPKPWSVGLGFGADGRLNVRDFIRKYTGSYRTSGNRITVRGIATYGTLYGSPDARALSSLLVPTSSHADSVTSAFSLTATTLTIKSSRWTLIFSPLGAADRYCLDSPPLRAGTGTSLVPATPTALTICPPGGLAKTVTDIAELVHTLDALPTSPDSNGFAKSKLHPWLCSIVPAAGRYELHFYELHFHYRSGPDVLVNVLQPCQHSINNQKLQVAFSPRTLFPVIRAALNGS